MRDRLLYVVISLGLGAGLIGAYGRERHEGRAPDMNWWISRLCIIPFLGIVASFSVEQFSLSNQQATFLSAVLAIMGYEAVRIILDRAKSKGEAAIKIIEDTVGGGTVAADVPPAARPYYTAVDTDKAGRATAHIEQVNANSPRRGAIGEALRQSFDAGTADDEGLAQIRSIIPDEI